MCLITEAIEPFHSDDPIIAYKIMWRFRDNDEEINVVESLYAGNAYEIGKTYDAERPLRNRVAKSPMYTRGFHAYEYISEALWSYYSPSVYVLVKVELSDVRFKGFEDHIPVFVANKCKFLEVIDDWVTDSANPHSRIISAKDKALEDKVLQ